MDPRLKLRICTICKLPSDNDLVKKLDIISNQLEVHPHQYEILSLILLIVHQILLARCGVGPIQIVA